MTQREIQIHRRTRDRQFLLFGAILIGVAFGLIGLAASLWHPPGHEFRVVPADGTREISVEEITEHGRDLDGLAGMIRQLATGGEGPLDARHHRATNLVAGAHLPDADAARLNLLADALLGEASVQGQAMEALKKAAAATPPRRFDHEWLADVLSVRQEFDEAARGYAHEGRTFPDAGRARHRAFELALHHADAEKLQRLLDDPTMIRDVDPGEVARAQARCGNYRGVFAATLSLQMSQWTSWFHTTISLLCGVLWWLIFARIAGVPPRRWWLALPALALGVFATTLTLVAQFVVPVSSEGGGDFFQRAFFFILTVGFREETLKLVCAVPLIVLLRREKSANVVFIVLCTVGLGFAVEENINYLAADPSGAWDRFLLANFLHLALTGMLAYSLWRACRGAVRGWEHFVATFVLAGLTHGAYDLCLGSVLEENLSILSILIFVAVAYRYFGQLRSVAELSRQVVSPLAVFIFGSAWMLGLTFAALCWVMGVRLGTSLFLNEAIGIAPIAFLFIREFRYD